jgi:glycine C-acetyltransferase
VDILLVRPKEAITLLRQKSRPYLFSNSIAPAVAGAGIKMFDMMMKSSDLKEKLDSNTAIFRTEMVKAGFRILGHPQHPIAPVLLEDAGVAQKFASKLLDKGIYVIAFSFPVVPKGLARIRVQLSAGHTNDQVREAVKAFIEVGKELNVIKS